MDVNSFSNHLIEADRTLNLRGVFTGVQLAKGKVMMGKARAAACEDISASASTSQACAKAAAGCGTDFRPSPTNRAIVKRVRRALFLNGPKNRTLARVCLCKFIGCATASKRSATSIHPAWPRFRHRVCLQN